MTRDELIDKVRQAFTLATAGRTAARGALAGTRGFTEKRMFGGVAFFLHGNLLAGTASGDLLLRVGKANEAAALKEPGARPVVMGGRRIGGYVYVDAATLRDQRALTRWLRRALDYVRTLPKKAAKGGVRKPAAKSRTKRKAGPRGGKRRGA